MISIDPLDVLDRYGLPAALGIAVVCALATIAWYAFKTRKGRMMTLAEEYDLYERALADAKTDEERAELEGVRRSIIRRMAGWRPPFPLYAVVTNCPVGVACALMLAATVMLGGDFWAAVKWTLLLVGVETLLNLAALVAMRGPRPPRGRHFR